MIKKNEKKIYLLIIAIIILIVTPNFSMATGGFINPNDYEPASTNSVSGGDTSFKNMGNTIVGVIKIVGTIISVATFIIIGIKYMIASVEERAEYKKTMLPYIIGATLLFGITNILAIIASITQEVIQ